MSEGTWEKFSQVAVKGAEHDSRERQPHPKCLEGTRVALLNHIYALSDTKEKGRLIWLHGTAGVGKSAVAFTVAERMRGLKMREETKVETRLGGTFFFSRKHTKRRTTGHFFVTLAYQLALNFPSVQSDVNSAILKNPALLDPDTPLRKQMEGLFLQPLRKLKLRLRECPPLSFVVDALDECSSESLDKSTSESEIADLISLLGKALFQPDMPVIHILLTSRLEEYIRKAMQTEEMRPLVVEIPVKTSGEGVAATISLDGADVDNDIYTFLKHSFRDLESRHPDFPQPSMDQLTRLASRAGRRFIVAATMVKFIDNPEDDPRDRLQLMLELTSELLPETEVYKLYDCILSTCADSALAYLHLSVVAALADPLPISQISKLLGPSRGQDVERVLIQLRSVIDIPADSSLPVNIYHSSVRDYVSHHSNCSLRQVQNITSPHSLLAHCSLRLMIEDLPDRSALQDALSRLKKQSQAMEAHDPQSLTHSLSFVVQPLEPIQVLVTLLWLRGDRRSEIHFWLDTLDGGAWLRTPVGNDWLLTQGGKDWLQTRFGREWLQTPGGQEWLQFPEGRQWLQASDGREWLQTQYGRDWLQTEGGREWLQSPDGGDWLYAQDGDGREWLQTGDGREWLRTEGGREWLQTEGGRDWLQSPDGRDWLRASDGRVWLRQVGGGRVWLQIPDGEDWLQSQDGREWLQTMGGQMWLWLPLRLYRPEFIFDHDFWRPSYTTRHVSVEWLGTQRGQRWLQIRDGQKWLQTLSAQKWLQAPSGREWLQMKGGQEWLKMDSGQEWLQTPDGNTWLQTPDGQRIQQRQVTALLCSLLMEDRRPTRLATRRRREWLTTRCGQEWLRTRRGREWLQTQDGQKWLQIQSKREQLNPWPTQLWLKSQLRQDWLQTIRARGLLRPLPKQRRLYIHGGRDWLQTQNGTNMLQKGEREWLQGRGRLHTISDPCRPDQLNSLDEPLLKTTGGGNWAQHCGKRDWLQTPGGRDWLQTPRGHWLQTPSGRYWLHTQCGQDWLQTQCARDWLQTQGGQDWLQIQGARDWLQTQGGQEWLQTQAGRDWLHTQAGRDWLQTQAGRDWLQTPSARNWVQTPDGRDWLQTPHGQMWRLSVVWLTMEEFSNTLEAIKQHIIIPELSSQPAFQAIQQFKNLPDFLMFPAFLALRHQDHSSSTLPQGRLPPDMEIIHAMKAFSHFANEARERSRLPSDVLDYACQNWAVHISRAPNPWDKKLAHIFKSFWDRHLLDWLERQWCAKGLQSCLTILSEGEKLVKEHILRAPGLSQ